MEWFVLLPPAIGVVFSLGAAYFDLKTRKVPNVYNLAFLILALLLNLALIPLSLDYLLSGLLGLLVGFFILLLPYLIRAAGAGDVKMLAVLGMLLGWKGILWVFLFTGLWDGAVLLPLRFGKTMWLFANIPAPITDKFNNFGEHLKGLKRDRKQPFALPLALGCSTYLLLYIFGNEYLIETMGPGWDLSLLL